MDTNKPKRHIIRLHLKQSGKNLFFSNLKALFDNMELSPNDGSLGVRYNYLRNYKFSDGGYENDLVIIEKHEVISEVKRDWVRYKSK
ncbi:MAG: hypothetical protein KBT22_06490 [Bacteroidales bacterium]|nr:hypothetical protein [Candidatus Scybalocola fimicaballi]